MVTIRFSTPLRTATNGDSKHKLEFNGPLKELLSNLENYYGSSFKTKILSDGKPLRFINIYVNGEDIRYLQFLETEINKNDLIEFIPALSGGLA